MSIFPRVLFLGTGYDVIGESPEGSPYDRRCTGCASVVVPSENDKGILKHPAAGHDIWDAKVICNYVADLVIYK